MGPILATAIQLYLSQLQSVGLGNSVTDGLESCLSLIDSCLQFETEWRQPESSDLNEALPVAKAPVTDSQSVSQLFE